VLAGATWAAGLAARDACTVAAAVTPELKWPNDLFVGGRKLAGVLAETVVESGVVTAVVVGVGLNVTWTEPPPADVAERATTLSAAAARAVDREAVLQGYLAALGPLVHQWCADAGGLLARYRAALATIGRLVRVEQADGELTGVATGVTVDGALVVRADDGIDHVFHAGDVVHLH
jgi:BirA family biotin operon repressor/biotin-[acetyl-CoA-carboxylase] ligase